ncbi:MAG: hypothetical protein H6779_03680 [Candidatus Nomurabacteria bacterium]|nr:MAG: hypothetical protein H6779_03680 [Candidatus Nomurabacteria bacterium]
MKKIITILVAVMPLIISLFFIYKESCSEVIVHYDKIHAFVSIGKQTEAEAFARQTFRNASEEYNTSKEMDCDCQEKHKLNLAKAAYVLGSILSLQNNNEALYFIEMAIELDPGNDSYTETKERVAAILSLSS